LGESDALRVSHEATCLGPSAGALYSWIARGKQRRVGGAASLHNLRMNLLVPAAFRTLLHPARIVVPLACTAFLAGGCASTGLEHLPAEGALGPYSAAVSSGRLCFLSGKVGKSGQSFGEDVEAAIDSIEKDLRRLGLDLADVASVTVYVTDMAAYPELNAAYAKRFSQPYPARTTVAVQALPRGARVEIQAIAVRRS
jgi:2-iminobutanoate/2-iminopropanoate deaminase